VIEIGNSNTVRTLRDQLARLVRAGYADTGFPILETDAANGKSRMLGFIGGNELEHALSRSSSLCILIWASLHVLVLIQCFFFFTGIVADEADRPVFFYPDSGLRFRRTLSVSSMSSIVDDAEDPFNFSVYMDKVRRSAVNSPFKHFLLIRVARARPFVM
jgi:chloride channel 3/4/5